MPDRKIEESPMLAQVQADENVAGSRVRKEAQRAASRDEQRAGRTNEKGVPQWNSHLDDQEKSDGFRGYAESPKPERVVVVAPVVTEE